METIGNIIACVLGIQLIGLAMVAYALLSTGLY
jgi:hypothetical protein